MNITISDTSLMGNVFNEVELKVKQEKLTLEELIKARVTAEVEQYNKEQRGVFNGLIQPRGSEIELNGYKVKEKKLLDPEKQCFVALQSFQKNGFFVLVDDQQIEGLQEEVVVHEYSKIEFLKLTPLVGG